MSGPFHDISHQSPMEAAGHIAEAGTVGWYFHAVATRKDVQRSKGALLPRIQTRNKTEEVAQFGAHIMLIHWFIWPVIAILLKVYAVLSIAACVAPVYLISTQHPSDAALLGTALLMFLVWLYVFVWKLGFKGIGKLIWRI